MTTSREMAIDNLETTLRGITTGNGFYQTVVTLERRSVGAAAFSSAERPAIEMVLGTRWDYSEESFKSDLLRELVIIVVHLSTEDTAATENRDVARMRHDICKAVMADPMRGGYARRTRMGPGKSIEALQESERLPTSAFEQHIILELEEQQAV